MIRPGYKIEELKIGQTAKMVKAVSDADITKFAEVSGDHNPVHLDESYAATTQFKGRIAHGMLSVSFISAVLGNDLPGAGSIYLGQSLKFKAPVRPNDTVTTVVTVKEIIADKKRVILTTQCFVSETMVIDGEATIMVP